MASVILNGVRKSFGSTEVVQGAGVAAASHVCWSTTRPDSRV